MQMVTRSQRAGSWGDTEGVITGAYDMEIGGFCFQTDYKLAPEIVFGHRDRWWSAN